MGQNGAKSLTKQSKIAVKWFKMSSLNKEKKANARTPAYRRIILKQKSLKPFDSRLLAFSEGHGTVFQHIYKRSGYIF